ncbi:MAG: hypothetical protein HQL47_00045 [Gammaproteobacteria bacterium]|nr:hypothetical protein [Gammaproteobacteria bacterium]
MNPIALPLLHYALHCCAQFAAGLDLIHHLGPTLKQAETAGDLHQSLCLAADLCQGVPTEKLLLHEPNPMPTLIDYLKALQRLMLLIASSTDPLAHQLIEAHALLLEARGGLNEACTQPSLLLLDPASLGQTGLQPGFRPSQVVQS